MSTPKQLLCSTREMQSFDRLVNLCHLLMQCADVPGDVVEFGCHEGLTAMLLSSLTTKHLNLYDSFEGLPKPSDRDLNRDPFVKGAMTTDFFAVTHRFMEAGLPIPTVYKGWFKDVCSFEMPERIAFAHIDGDFYDSTRTALEKVYLLLSIGAICVIDDYDYVQLPGVKVAVDEFMSDKEQIIVPIGICGEISQHCWFKKA